MVGVTQYGMRVRWEGQELQLPFRNMQSYALRRRWLIGRRYVRVVMDNCTYRIYGTKTALRSLMKILTHNESIYNSH